MTFSPNTKQQARIIILPIERLLWSCIRQKHVVLRSTINEDIGCSIFEVIRTVWKVWFNQKEQHAINPWHSIVLLPKIHWIGCIQVYLIHFINVFTISLYFTQTYEYYHLFSLKDSKSPLLANRLIFVTILKISSLEFQDSKSPLLANLVSSVRPFSCWPLSTSCHSDTTWELGRNIFKYHKLSTIIFKDFGEAVIFRLSQKLRNIVQRKMLCLWTEWMLKTGKVG